VPPHAARVIEAMYYVKKGQFLYCMATSNQDCSKPINTPSLSILLYPCVCYNTRTWSRFLWETFSHAVVIARRSIRLHYVFHPVRHCAPRRCVRTL